jgi:hypothetical protein
MLSVPCCLLAQTEPAGLAAVRRLAPGSPGIVLTAARPGGQPQLHVLDWAGRLRPLAPGLLASADPDVSFDAKRVVFAGRRAAGEPWQIYELELAGGEPRRITNSPEDCRQPVYQSRIFSLDIPLPWPQVAYVAGGSLHTVKLDGSLHQQVTFTPSRDADPVILPDGRMIYASTAAGRTALMGVNLDGTDYALFVEGSNPRSPAVAGESEVVYVEGRGALSSVRLERPLHSRKVLTAAEAGVFSTPAGLPDGTVMASWKAGAGGVEALVRLDRAGRKQVVFSRPGIGLRQAKLIAPREEPAGRGSVVDEAAKWARLYCQSVYTTDQPGVVNGRTVKRVRVLGGPAASPRTLGEAELEDDGSFHLEVPPDEPLKLELLSASGAVVRSSAWIFARKKENRGCIGCHEDPELTPENREAKAVVKKPVSVLRPGGAR